MSTESPQPATAPTRPTERIVAIDILRGFALLGILIMNIQGFAMPAAAYANPTVYGDLTGANRWVWTLSHIFADPTSMTIFPMHLGAAIVQRCSTPQSQVVIVPPPELPVTPMCFESTSSRVRR